MATVEQMKLLALAPEGAGFSMTLEAPPAFAARPGQFAALLCGEKMLRRPISICDLTDNRLRLVFESKGEGTRWLSQRKEGERLDVLAPLGNGYHLPAGERPVLLIGGGVGAPPLYFALKETAAPCDVILGFRTAEGRYLTGDFSDLLTEKGQGGKLYIATDDGTMGEQGTVVPILRRLLPQKDWGAVLACGPKVMLRAVAALCKEAGVPCQVSLEERMGCCVGACLGCAVAVHGEKGVRYAHVCKDGPVFLGEEVVWDD